MLKYLLLVLFVLICAMVIWAYHVHPISPSQVSFQPTAPPQQFTFGKLIDAEIDLRYLDDFLSPEECNHLINLAKDKLARSQVIDHSDNTVDRNRTSYSYYIPNGADDIIRGIEEKVAKMVGKTVGHIEGLQVVRYNPGDYFKSHHDWFHTPYRNKVNNQRQYTFFVYLNDIQGAGGQTEFPHLGKEFYPKQGHALFWQNCESLDKCYDKALHQGKAPLDDTKFGLNVWIQFKPIGSD